MFKKILTQTGPGPLIAAAFIGPGTITLCTLVGAQYGLELIWAILVAIIAAIVLQGMAVRLGIIGQKSITQAIEEEIKTPWLKTGLLVLIFLAIMIGNTAYEAGNISGSVLGLETLFGKKSLNALGFKINLFSMGIGGDFCEFTMDRKIQNHRAKFDSIGDSNEHFIFNHCYCNRPSHH